MTSQLSWTRVVIVMSVVLSASKNVCEAQGLTATQQAATPTATQTAAVQGTEGLACEGGHLSLLCPPSTYININMQSVLFGRDDNNITCPHPTANTNITCSAVNASVILAAFCQGRQTCDVTATTTYFTEPCMTVYKYLRVMYTCSPCVNALGNDAQCEMQALEGQCALNSSTGASMAVNCARACYKCEASIAPVCANVNATTQCALLASQGQCTSNPASMTAYCKQSCGQCYNYTQCVNNFVNSTACNIWNTWTQPQCAFNPNWMIPNCAQTCFACTGPTIKCQNQNPMCDTWSQLQQCTANPGYMAPICTQSCLGCTSDPACMDMDTVNCPGWASNLQCQLNPVWMFQNCWKSCTGCAGAPPCVNNYADALCEGMANTGQCSSGNVADMYLNCRKSCTRCAAWSGPKPNCYNLNGNTKCAALQAAGVCLTDPLFMYTNCFQACSGCVANTTYSIQKLGVGQLPGATLASNAAYNVILPFNFTVASIVTEFVGFFASNTPVYLQIWRPNGTNLFNLINQIQYTPTAVNASLQVIVTSTCMLTLPGDQIGFTSIVGPASVGYTLLTGNAFTPISLKQVTYTGPFFTAYMPLSYSLAAVYQAGTSCNTIQG